MADKPKSPRKRAPKQAEMTEQLSERSELRLCLDGELNDEGIEQAKARGYWWANAQGGTGLAGEDTPDESVITDLTNLLVYLINRTENDRIRPAGAALLG